MILSIIIPTLLILIPIVGFIIYRFRITKRIRPKFIISGLIAIILGLILPWIATFISAHGLATGMPDDAPKCVTGAATFWFFGYVINLIGIPLIGLIFYILAKELDSSKRYD